MIEAARSRWIPALVWIALAALMAAGLWRGLWTPDEPREAGMGREMLEHPGFIPLLNGRPFYEKPPLYYWALAGAFSATGGPSAPAARAVSVLSCLGILLLTYRGVRRAAGGRAALGSLLILGTCLGFFRDSQWVLLDPFLALWTTLALWGAFECLSGQGRLAWLAMAGGLSLALWTKGLVGVALLAPGWAAMAWFHRKEGLLRRFRPFATVAALAAAALACVGGFYLSGGREALYQFLWVNHVQRLIHPVGTGHAEPATYYLLALPVALLPWVLLLPALFRPAFWRTRGHEEAPLLRPFLGWTALGGLLVLTAAATKRETYLLPLLPVLAPLLALAVDDLLCEGAAGGRWVRGLLRYVHPWIPALWAVVPPLALWAYSGRVGPSGIVFLCLGAAVALASVILSMRGAAGALGLQATAAFVGCASLLFVVAPPLDRVKNLGPFVEKMGRLLPAGAPVAALSADETLYGIIPFVTGRDVAGLTDDELAALVLSGRRPPFLVEQEDPRNRRPRDPGILGYRPVMQESFGPRRTIRLWQDGMDAPARSAAPPLPDPQGASRPPASAERDGAERSERAMASTEASQR